MFYEKTIKLGKIYSILLILKIYLLTYLGILLNIIDIQRQTRCITVIRSLLLQQKTYFIKCKSTHILSGI